MSALRGPATPNARGLTKRNGRLGTGNRQRATGNGRSVVGSQPPSARRLLNRTSDRGRAKHDGAVKSIELVSRTGVAHLRAFWPRRRRVLLAAGIATLAIVVARCASSFASEGSHEASLAAVLAKDGLNVDPASVVWLEEDPGPLAMRPALFLGARERELADLYYGEARTARGGAVLDVGWITNLTRTSSAAEGKPLRLGDHALYVSRVGDRYDAFVVLDLAGEPRSLTADWTRRARAQNAITNLQETGRTRGFGRRRYGLTSPVARLRARIDGKRFVVDADGARIVIDPARAAPLAGAERVEVRPSDKGAPGGLTWIVDTVRNVSWIGPHPIEWLEHNVFAVIDFVQRKYRGVVGTNTAAEVAEELGLPTMSARQRARLRATDPEIGFPPPALAPVLRGERVQGEGEWNPIADDPFVRTYPNAPPAFYQTFVRADPEREFTRIYVTIWDPRAVQLHIMMGTREPESATGETGPGLVPRDPETMRRVVAGFNGGFQAMHGEFGMMADERVYIPPKPWAATVALFDDGHVGMGSWPAPPGGRHDYDERAQTSQVPEEMVAFRQNLTSVVEDGVYNPWQRWWWGAAPPNATEQTYTHRAGMCLTRESFLAFFWGTDMGPDAMGRAMIAARCVRGMHLDMNHGHCGFELYNVRPSNERFEPLGRALDPDSEYDGPLPNADGYLLRARKAVKTMELLRFPRYIRRDPRDFFYLTLKPILPGPSIPTHSRSAEEGRFSTAGLPHSGWPHAFARAYLGEEEDERTWIVRIDPARAVASPVAAADARRPLAYLASGRALARDGGAYGLYATRGAIGWRYAVGQPPAGARMIVAGLDLGTDPDAEAAVGVDEDGFLVYAESHDDDEASLVERMRQARVARAVALSTSRLAFVGDDPTRGVGVNGEDEVTVDPASSLVFFAQERPVTEVMWPEVRPMPYGRWGRLQGQRVRYFPQPHTARFLRPADNRRADEDAGVQGRR